MVPLARGGAELLSMCSIFSTTTIVRPRGYKRKYCLKVMPTCNSQQFGASVSDDRTGLLTQLQHDRAWEGSAALCKKILARRSREPFLAMVRLECLLYAVGLTALGAGKTDAFYLPRGAPNSFGKGEKVRHPSSEAAALCPMHCLLPRRNFVGTASVGVTISLVMCISKQDQGISWVPVFCLGDGDVASRWP